MTRSPKQKAAAQRLNAAIADRYTIANRAGLALIGADAGLPTESWWTTPRTRQEFDQAVAQERGRMALSTFARGTGLPTMGVR